VVLPAEVSKSSYRMIWGAVPSNGRCYVVGLQAVFIDGCIDLLDDRALNEVCTLFTCVMRRASSAFGRSVH
jgi:hypothetical protein